MTRLLQFRIYLDNDGVFCFRPRKTKPLRCMSGLNATTYLECRGTQPSTCTRHRPSKCP